jgi:hypothetical protein
VLPHDFVRIRHSGLLASGNVRGALAKAKSVLETSRPLPIAPPPNSTEPASDEQPHERLYRELTGVDLRVCTLR